MPTFIYHHGNEQDRGRHQGNEPIPHEVLKDQEPAVRLELRHNMAAPHAEATNFGQGYVYEFVDTNNSKPKPVSICCEKNRKLLLAELVGNFIVL